MGERVVRRDRLCEHGRGTTHRIEGVQTVILLKALAVIALLAAFIVGTGGWRRT